MMDEGRDRCASSLASAVRGEREEEEKKRKKEIERVSSGGGVWYISPYFSEA